MSTRVPVRQHVSSTLWTPLTARRVAVLLAVVVCVTSIVHISSYQKNTMAFTIEKVQTVVRLVQRKCNYIKSLLTRTPTVPANGDKRASSLVTGSTSLSTHPRVVVIGGGLAGCVAAIEAAKTGAQVILLEKEFKLGGNSAKATSGMNGWGTRAQVEQAIADSAELFERDTYRSGVGGNCDPGLVRMLSVKSADAVKFLTDFGIPLSVLSQLGGASRKRCHRAPDKSDGTPVAVGFFVLRTLDKYIRENMSDKITVVLNAQVTRLVVDSRTKDDGSVMKLVTGVEYTIQPKAKPDPSRLSNQTIDTPSPSKRMPPHNSAPVTIATSTVILATGGFSNDHTNRSLLQEFAPHLSSFPTTNGEWATGDGVKMARELGVELVDMDKVQLHPTGLIDPKNPSSRTKFLGPEALRGSGGVLLNKTGERFVNELDLRSVVSQAIIAQNNEYPGSGGSKFAYCVLNEAAAKLFGKNALSFYWKQLGLFVRVENTEELAKLIGCNVEVLKRTLAQYEQISSSKVQACHVTGKNVFPCVLGMQGPYYVAYVTPSIHYTMGGCLITPSAEMQTTDITNILSQRESRSVLGLFGAGEVTGGLHGMNRLGGNSLLECVVFGRIAGQRAGNSALLGHGVLFSSHEQSDANIAKVVLSVRAVQFVCNPCEVNEVGERDIVLNLASAYQLSGLAVLESVRLRSLSDPALPSVSLIPSSLPDDFGMLSFHLPARSDQTKAKWLYTLEPGTEVEVLLDKHSNDDVKCDVHVRERALMRLQQQCTRIVVVAGGECAVAATVQLIRVLVQFIRVHQVSMHARGQQQEQEAHALQLSSLHVVYLTEAQQSSYGEQLLSEMSKNAQNILSVQFVKMRSDRGEECKEELSHDEATVLRTALSPSKTSADDMGVIVVGAVENMQRVASHIQANDYIADKAFMLQYFVPHEGV